MNAGSFGSKSRPWRRLRTWLLNRWDDVRYVTNWRLVRSVGQLQILTRASYALLVLVPLLAASWPGIQTLVRGERAAIERANAALQGSAAALGRKIDQARELAPTVEQLQGVAERVESAAAVVQQASMSWRLDDAQFPWTLAAAFFAALLVVVGHFFYQTSAPETVRTLSWDAYVDHRRESFGRGRTVEALDRARDALNTRAGKRVDANFQRRNFDALFHFYGRLETLKDIDDALEDVPVTQALAMREAARNEHFKAKPEVREKIVAALTTYVDSFKAIDPSRSDESIYELGLIERGSRAEYQDLAGRNPLMIIVTMLTYSVAMWLILAVVYVQARSVLSVAGIHSLRALFIP